MDANQTERTNRAKASKMEAAAEAIRKRLRIETLADRNRDALDFHEVSVAQIRDAIEMAFEAGFEAAESLNA
jgi:sulfate adenylyltransferase subunit 1 (EFTu-like GTPase family)